MKKLEIKLKIRLTTITIKIISIKIIKIKIYKCYKTK